jgi:hypothetical protein
MPRRRNPDRISSPELHVYEDYTVTFAWNSAKTSSVRSFRFKRLFADNASSLHVHSYERPERNSEHVQCSDGGRSEAALASMASTFNKLITSPSTNKQTHTHTHTSTHWNKLIITDLYSASVNKLWTALASWTSTARACLWRQRITDSSQWEGCCLYSCWSRSFTSLQLSCHVR